LGGTATLNVTPSTKGVPLPGPATVNLPFQNNLDVVSSQLSIYASADGTTYLRIQDSYVNAGFLQSSLPKFGFVFAGYPQTAADLVACGASGGAP
jgi:hypothetical protein